MEAEAHLRDLSQELRAAAARLDARRVALGRNALVWWEGEAAEHYQHRVALRVTGLHGLSREMEEAARLADHVAGLMAALQDRG